MVTKNTFLDWKPPVHEEVKQLQRCNSDPGTPSMSTSSSASSWHAPSLLEHVERESMDFSARAISETGDPAASPNAPAKGEDHEGLGAPRTPLTRTQRRRLQRKVLEATFRRQQTAAMAEEAPEEGHASPRRGARIIKGAPGAAELTDHGHREGRREEEQRGAGSASGSE
jgi:hypothetical protein